MSHHESPSRVLDWSVQPPYLYSPYVATVRRAPHHPLVPLPASLLERTGPVYGEGDIGPLDHDLTKNAAKNGEPLGERIIVTGRVLDESGRGVPGVLVEIWQANAAGRYIHKNDQHDAPLDPNFVGAGRTLTDDQGYYRFITIKPGPTLAQPPQRLAARPHPLFPDWAQLQRAVGDPDVLPRRPLAQVRPHLPGHPQHQGPRAVLISSFDLETTRPEWALGYRFDIVLAGYDRTYFEEDH